jgi:hypothetical protein
MARVRVGPDGAFEAAAWAPLLCGIHCVVTPGLALLAPALVISQSAEIGIMMVAGTLAALAFAWGVRAHGRFEPALPLLGGGILWVAGLADWLPLPEWLLAGSGGVLMFIGIRWSTQLRERALAGSCACGSCES